MTLRSKRRVGKTGEGFLAAVGEWLNPFELLDLGDGEGIVVLLAFVAFFLVIAFLFGALDRSGALDGNVLTLNLTDPPRLG